MPRTFVPEEQQRVDNLTELRDTIRPTPERVVTVESDADGLPNKFYWDGGAEATNADGVSSIASNITQFADGGAEEGLWRRVIEPITSQTATTDDLTEGSNNLYFTDERAQDAVGGILGGQFTYDDENNAITLNQGDGSGLNADTLDGFDESAFAKLADNETITGQYTFDAATTIGTNGGLALSGNRITNVGEPTNAQDAATKNYVDAVEQGLDLKDSVRAATAGSSIDLASTTDPNPIDGVTLADGDRILLKDQSTASENGIYEAVTATDPSSWVRSEDANDDAEVTGGMFTFVEEGNNNSDDGFVLTTDSPTLGTDALNFTQFSGAGQITAGDGISKSGDTLSVNTSDLVGSGLKEDASTPTNITVEPTDFAGNGLVDDGSDNMQLDIGVADSGSDVTASTSIYDLNFGSSLTVTDDTGTDAGRVTIDVDAAGSTSIDINDSGTDVATGINSLNFGTNIFATDNTAGDGAVTINGLSDENIQDTIYNNVLTGTQTLITVTYDDANNEVDYVVNDDLSQYSFTNVSTDDISEGTTNLYYTDERVSTQVDSLLTEGNNVTLTYDDAGDSLTIDAATNIDVDDSGTDVTTGVNNLNFASGLTVTDGTAGDGTVTIDASSASSSISDDGTQVLSSTDDINFGAELDVTDDGDGSVSVDFGAVAIDEMGQATFSGDGSQEQFTISHSLGVVPNSWMVHPTTDDGSTPSHTQADSNQLTVVYDTPPPSGNDNITLNYIIQA